MFLSVKSQTGTAKSRDQCLLLVYGTAKGAHPSVGMQTGSGQDDYDRKLSLIQRAFNEISRLVFDCDYTLTPDDWRVLDEARLDDPTLSYAEVRARLVQVYQRIRRACVEKGVSYAQRKAQEVR